jgi:carboxyl-terminal processing protease
LVQTVYNLPENTGLALTTYHYYTPSGRLIQRDYNGVSLYDYYNHANALPADKTNKEVKLTDSGRTVYGGGGITPDEKIESPKSNSVHGYTALSRSILLPLAPHYMVNHHGHGRLQGRRRSADRIQAVPDQPDIPWTNEDFTRPIDWVKANIKSELLATQFGQLQGLRVRADWDPMIQKAVTYLPEAQALEDTAHKVLAEKAEARNGSTN